MEDCDGGGDGGRVGVVGAEAALGEEVAVVLDHVEVVAFDDALEFCGGPGLGGGDAEVDGLAFEFFGFPVGAEVGDHPVDDFGVADVEGVGLGGEGGLGPVGPDAEFEACGVGLVGDEGEAVGEFFGVGDPVADVAEPAGVDVVHLEAEFFGVVDHAEG